MPAQLGYAPPMTDSEFITRADVERVNKSVQNILVDIDKVRADGDADTATVWVMTVYRSIQGVLGDLLGLDEGYWVPATIIELGDEWLAKSEAAEESTAPSAT